MKRLVRGMQYRVTNMRNVHTFATSIVDLLLTMIILPSVKLVKISRDVISGPAVHVPVCVNSIGTLLLMSIIIIIVIRVAPPTLIGWMAILFAYLTCHILWL